MKISSAVDAVVKTMDYYINMQYVLGVGHFRRYGSCNTSQ
jgi:hypothetical protein